MPTYYVRPTGNDTTGDGSNGNPWASISKAISTVSAGDTVNIGAGTYQENTSSTGRLQITRQFASETIFQSETGNPADVIIQGLSDATINTVFQGDCQWLHFKNVSFRMRVNTNVHAVRLSNCNNIKFSNCTATVKTRSGTTNAAINIQPSGAGTLSNITFTDCTINADGSDTARGAAVVWTAGNTISDISFVNCTGQMVADCLYLQGGSNYLIDGGNWLSANTHAVTFGADAATGGNPTTGEIRNAIVSCTTGHALLAGHGAANIAINDCAVNGGDYALVLKESSGHVVQRCTLIGGTLSAAYYKAAVNCSILNSILIASAGNFGVVRLGVGDTGNKCQNATLTDCRLKALGTVAMFNWADSTGDLGGGVVDRNTYALKGSGNFGSVYGTTDIADLTALRAAWSGYSVPTNDANSKMFRNRRSRVAAGVML